MAATASGVVLPHNLSVTSGSASYEVMNAMKHLSYRYVGQFNFGVGSPRGVVRVRTNASNGGAVPTQDPAGSGLGVIMTYPEGHMYVQTQAPRQVGGVNHITAMKLPARLGGPPFRPLRISYATGAARASG